jgi:hypothetical protein
VPLDLPRNPDLEQLKTLAKELLVALRAGETSALARLGEHLPARAAQPADLRLAHAQAVIAREYGFASWPKLKQRVELLSRAASRRSIAAEVSAAEMRDFRLRTAAEMAEAWVRLAERGELNRLLVTMAIGRTKGLEVRDLLAKSGGLAVIVDLLLIGVRHRKPNVRYLSAHAMDMFSDERCLVALLELLDDPVPRVRRSAVHSLVCDDCKVVPFGPSVSAGDVVARVVDMALNDPSIQVRRHAVVALSHFDDPRVNATLETLIERETDVPLVRNVRAMLKKARAMAS